MRPIFRTINVDELLATHRSIFGDARMEAPAVAFELPADLTSVDASELESTSADAVSRFDELNKREATELSDADVAEMGRLADAIDSIAGEFVRRESAAGERAAKVAELNSRVHAEPEDGDDPVEPAAGDEPADSAEPVEPAEPGDAPAVDGAGAPVAIAASGAPSVAAVAARTRPRGIADVKSRQRYRGEKAAIIASAGVPGVAAGAELTLSDMADAAIRIAGSFPKGAHGSRTVGSIGRVVIPPQEGLVASSNGFFEAGDLLEAAVDQSRLPGGSLLASGGWCAPSETLYDLCSLETTDGLLSVPEITIARGGVRFTTGPAFSDVFSGAGFVQTEAMDIAGDSKAVFHVPCATFVEKRLDAIGLILTAGILANKAYPELIQRWIDGSLVAHAHRLNGQVLSRIAAGSVAATIVAPGTSATSTLLASVELAVIDIRNRNRMALDAPIEIVLPAWVMGAIRSDFGKMHGVDDPYGVTDAMINGWFTERGANVQWVVDWQDEFSVTPAAGIGGPTPALVWPATVEFLAYPAGTWVRGSGNIITIDALYDSTLNATNDYTAIFTEEGLLMAQKCVDSRVYTVPICPTGEQAPLATMHACPIV